MLERHKFHDGRAKSDISPPPQRKRFGMEEEMNNMLLETAVRTGDSGGTSTYIIIGVVCVVVILAVAVLGILSKKNK